MNATHKLTFDLVRQTEIIPPICAVQGDTATRVLEITLRANGTAWTPPDGTSFALAFRKPDGNRGVYDTLPDGTAAVSVADNVVSVTLAPQVLTTPGNVVAMLLITDADVDRLSSFPFVISVAPDPSAGAPVSNNYYYFTSLDAINQAIGDLSQLETEAKSDLVSAINEAFGSGAKGLTAEEKKVILSLFKSAAYTSNVSAKVAELEALWSVSYKVSYSLTGATASNDATAVVEGGTYTTTLSAEGGYTLTGATVKVTMGGKDITSTAYKGGVINIASVTGNVVITVAAREIPSFTITNNLTNVTNSNSATKVTEGDFYSATLSWDSAYSLNSIVITMGGVDVTADVYGEGNILITEVTGDVVITAVAAEPEYVDITAYGLSNHTFYTGADNTSDVLTTRTSPTSIWVSNRAATVDTQLTIKLTNNTDETVSVTTNSNTHRVYAGCVEPSAEVLLGRPGNYSYYAKLLGELSTSITPGETYSYQYTLKAGYHLLLSCVDTLEVSVIGSIPEVELVNEYAFGESKQVVTLSFYNDAAGESLRQTKNLGFYQSVNTVPASGKLRLTICNTGDANITAYADNFLGFREAGTNNVYNTWYPSAYVLSLKPGVVYQREMDAIANCYIMSTLPPSCMYFETITEE